MELKHGYKKTELGIFPADWEVVLMGSLGTFSKGQGVRKSEAGSGHIPCVRYGELYTHHNDVVRSFNSRIAAGVAASSKRLKKGDILFAGSGETKEEIGKCAVFVGDEEAYAGGDIVILSPNKDDARFLGYLFNAPVIARQKASRGQGDAVVHISATALSSISLPLPPLPEQTAIAGALNDVDALIEALERLIAKKRDVKQAAMQQLLTGTIRLPGFHGQWEVKLLGDVVDTDPDNLGSETQPDFAFKYIALDDVDRGSLRNHSEVVFANAPSRARRELRTGDVLVSTVRPVLQSHLLFREGGSHWVCSTGFCVVRCREGVTNPGYIYYHLFASYVNRQIVAVLTGSNYPAISSGDVRALQIPLPAYAEQAVIAEVLSDMDAELTALEQRREKTRALKQAMLQELLTGKTRLV